MGTLSARSLTQALLQARNIGLVEEPFVVDGVAVTVRNLRPDQYDSIFKDCQGLSDVEYLNAWQMAHISRAICEVNGVDFRDVTTVEEEEADPKKPTQTRTVKVELHSWLQKNLLSGWSREALYICYRKVADAIEAGEKKAKEGVTFKTADESAEDKFRRLIVELKEIEGDVPDKVLDGILRDVGYVRRSTVDEMEAVQEKLSTLQNLEEDVAAEPPPQQVYAQQTVAPQQTVTPTETSAPPSADRIAELLRNRKPLNQPANPIVAQPEQVGEPYRQPIMPTGVQVPPVAAPVIPQHTPPQGNRAAEFAAIEGDVGGPSSELSGAFNPNSQGGKPEVVLGNQPRVDVNATRNIIDTPPVGGINPRFRPPT